MTNFLAYLSLVRQENINRLQGSMISNDSEADTNGKIYGCIGFIKLMC